MPFEIVPFLCGGLLCWWNPIRTRTLAISAVLIGGACAGFAGELTLPAPVALLAIGADTLGVIAGYAAVRFVKSVRRGDGSPLVGS